MEALEQRKAQLRAQAQQARTSSSREQFEQLHVELVQQLRDKGANASIHCARPKPREWQLQLAPHEHLLLRRDEDLMLQRVPVLLELQIPQLFIRQRLDVDFQPALWSSLTQLYALAKRLQEDAASDESTSAPADLSSCLTAAADAIMRGESPGATDSPASPADASEQEQVERLVATLPPNMQGLARLMPPRWLMNAQAIGEEIGARGADESIDDDQVRDQVRKKQIEMLETLTPDEVRQVFSRMHHILPAATSILQMFQKG